MPRLPGRLMKVDEERGGPPDALADGTAGELVTVLPVPADFPCPPAWRHQPEVRRGDRFPGPGGDLGVYGACWLGLDEAGGIGVVAHLVPDEPQPGEGPLGYPARGGIHAG